MFLSKIKVILILLLGILLSTASFFTHAETIEDGRYWLNFSLLGSLPVDDLSWTLDFRPRWRDESQNFDQFVASGFIIKQLNPKVSLGMGIDHVVNHPASREAFEENRLVQQFMFKFDDILGVKLQSRTRFEFRHREDFNDTAYRLREMLRASLSFSQYPNLSLVFFDELFLNINNTDWNIRRGIDQNRVFLGVNYKLGAHISIETGYLNQFINTRETDRENHIVNSTIRYSF